MEEIARERIFKCPECGSLVFAGEELATGDDLICPIGCATTLQIVISIKK